MSETAPRSKQNIRVGNEFVKYGMSKMEFGKFSLNHDGIPYVVTGPDDLFTTTKITYVKASDIDEVNYVTGSLGKTKTVKEYRTEYDTTNNAKLTTMLYEDIDNPTKPTSITVAIASIEGA